LAINDNKTVGNLDIRNYAAAIATLYLDKKTMAKQAKTLNQAELRKVLDYISTRKHSARNRAMLMITFLAGMRVAEVASLKFGDVVDIDGNIRNEIRLTPAMTKGEFARTVFVSERLRKELEQYIRFYNPTDKTMKFFYSQRKESNGFNANTLTQHFHYLYKRVGIVGASSHSGRRSFISNLAARGIGVRVLMGLAGHRAISSTQKYIEINDNMLRSAVELA
jgi:integrase/recombinase XerD